MNHQAIKQRRKLEALAGDNLLSLANWVTDNRRKRHTASLPLQRAKRLRIPFTAEFR